MIVPGHGRLADEHDLLEYRDMVTIIRDRVQKMIEKGMTLDQVRAARPTFEYEPRWGADDRLLDDGDVRRRGLQQSQGRQRIDHHWGNADETQGISLDRRRSCC